MTSQGEPAVWGPKQGETATAWSVETTAWVETGGGPWLAMVNEAQAGQARTVSVQLGPWSSLTLPPERLGELIRALTALDGLLGGDRLGAPEGIGPFRVERVEREAGEGDRVALTLSLEAFGRLTAGEIEQLARVVRDGGTVRLHVAGTAPTRRHHTTKTSNNER